MMCICLMLLCIRDLQLFFKRVRKMFPIDLKQFSCGEYGPSTMRKHYHAIVLGVDFKPWKLHGYRDGHPIYNSDILSKLWPFGFATVDEVNDQDIKYVTGYIRKKLSGPAADVYKRDGLEPPFQLQSKGIGLRYSVDNSVVLYRDLFLRVNGKIRRIPKYMARKIGLNEPLPDVGFLLCSLRLRRLFAKDLKSFISLLMLISILVLRLMILLPGFSVMLSLSVLLNFLVGEILYE